MKKILGIIILIAVVVGGFIFFFNQRNDSNNNQNYALMKKDNVYKSFSEKDLIDLEFKFEMGNGLLSNYKNTRNLHLRDYPDFINEIMKDDNKNYIGYYFQPGCPHCLKLENDGLLNLVKDSKNFFSADFYVFTEQIKNNKSLWDLSLNNAQTTNDKNIDHINGTPTVVVYNNKKPVAAIISDDFVVVKDFVNKYLQK